MDRMTNQRLGQWATRLYIILFIVGLFILTIYTFVQPQKQTKIFEKPSLNVYHHLNEKYGDQLKCSCSLIASTYNQFVNIEPLFHEVCSSSFASDEWRVNLTAGLIPDLSTYAQIDYRRFLSAHLQFLTGLCQLSNQSVTNTIEQFISSLLVSDQLLSEIHFNEHIHLLIEQSKSNAPTIFISLLSLIRNLNHGNAIVSTYGTNFMYTFPWYNEVGPYAVSQAMIYDNECSCALYSNCTTQATFIKINSSGSIPIKGLKMGCTPSESFRMSTLECFYDQSCINLIHEYTNYTGHVTSLSLRTNQSSINITIAELITNQFIEQWSVSMNYSSYFEKCLPSLCSFTYIQQINPLYIVTLILSCQGVSTCQLEFQPIEIYPSDLDDFLKSPVIGDFNNDNRLDLAFFSALTVSINVLPGNDNGTFDAEIISEMTDYAWVDSIILDDFNHDKQLDLAFVDTDANQINVLQGNGDATFEILTTFSTGNGSSPRDIIVADFNNDSYSDIAVVNYWKNNVGIFFGYGDGNFSAQITFSTGRDSCPVSITVADCNKDNYLDIIVVNQISKNIGVFLGDGNGNFEAQRTSFVGGGSNIYPVYIAVGDFNGDSLSDIVLSYESQQVIAVMFGYPNGAFGGRMKFTMESNVDSFPLIVSDFNGDGHLDIAVGQGDLYGLNVLVGNGNGNFEVQTILSTQYYTFIPSLSVGDFNSDGYQDIIAIGDYSSSLYILLNTCQCCIANIPETSTLVHQ
ncbi:unnamed protein product [Adineta steineri]|uniref:Uncharacterized protein n=1 Tax=Adineta steineri TaxID=433720 RepID=A0A819LU45_9BILA|nr:unnamed protein product [Adineta steineri]